LPAATIPRRSCGPWRTIRFSELTRAYSIARGKPVDDLALLESQQISADDPCVRLWWDAPRPPKLGSTRAESSATVMDPSATAVTIFRPDHSPVNRDRLRRVHSLIERLLRIAGIKRGNHQVRQRELGCDRHGGRLSRRDRLRSRATAPPSGSVPIRLACRRASDARSSPGDFPYQ